MSTTLTGTGDIVTLEMRAGVIRVTARDDRWTLEANPPRYRDVDATRGQLAEMLGLETDDVLEGARWVDTGNDQLVIPLRSADAVARCQPIASLLARHGRASDARYLAYVFADTAAGETKARFFFPKGSAIAEDPATGSACANLGGWLLERGLPVPLTRTVRQGDEVGRPSRLMLQVQGDRRILVTGEVVELGGGRLSL